MSKVIHQMMVTLDGYFAGPNGEVDWHNVDEEFNEYAVDLLSSAEALLFGRVTYELMVNFWSTPYAKANDPITADYMNSLPKIVFSKTLNRVEWENTRLVKENIGDEISKLKKQAEKNLLLLGSSNLALSLHQLDLIDEYRIFLNPIVLGRGKTLFEGVQNTFKLKLLKTRTFRSGNVLMYYKTA